MPVDRVLDQERRRFELVAQRDGAAAAREWAQRTLDIYREVLANGERTGIHSPYEEGFRRSVEALERLLRARESL